MARQMLHIVQTGCRVEGRLEPGHPRSYPTAEAAEIAGAAWSRRVDVVVVYSIEGDPETGVWDAPDLLAQYGAAEVIARAA